MGRGELTVTEGWTGADRLRPIPMCVTPTLRARMFKAVATRSPLAVALLVASTACADGPPEPIPFDEQAHAAQVADFARARDEELAAPDAWLSRIGLHWLEQGETTVGADSASGIVLPVAAAPRVGMLTVTGTEVRWRTEPGVPVTQGVDSTLNLQAGSGAIPPDVSGDPEVADALLTDDLGYGKFVVLRHGDLNWIVIRRGDRVALRVRDNAHPAYRDFHGVDRYDTDPAWRLTARWVPHEKTVSVPNVLGTVAETPSPAFLEFWVNGQRLTLDVVGEPDHGQYMMVFADATSGGETYGGGRYLWVPEPDARGRVVVDFNYAYNPPCVWTAFATCPLPTRDNRLPVRVEAGEKNWAH